MTSARELGNGGPNRNFRLQALLRVGAWLFVAIGVSGAVLAFDTFVSPEPRKLRMLFAVATAIPLACVAASFIEFLVGVPFSRLEALWRAYRHRRLIAWLVVFLFLFAPLLWLAAYIWVL